MTSSKVFKAALSGLVCLAGTSMVTAQPTTDQAFWRQPHIAKSFLGSYEANPRTEPPLSEEEQILLKPILTALSADPNSQAAKDIALSQILPIITPTSSAAFDFIAANFYVEKRDLKTAIKFYEQAVAKFPSFLRAVRNNAIMKVQEGRFEAAIKDFTKAIELGANDTTTMGLLGLSYVNTNKFVSAETAYRQAIVLDPTVKDWQIGLAKALLNQNKWADSIAVLEQLLVDDPENEILWSSVANAYLGLGDAETAVAIQEIVDRLGKSTPDSLLFMGNIYLSRGLNDLAVTYFERAVKMDPNQKAEVHISIAETIVSRGAYDQARAAINNIKATLSKQLTDDDKLRILRLEAQIALVKNEGELVVPILRQLIERDPLDGQALILLAEFNSSKGDTDSYIEADIYYGRATKIRDYEIRALLSWARSYVARNKYGEAIPLLERILVIEPAEHIQRYLDQVRKVYLASIGMR